VLIGFAFYPLLPIIVDLTRTRKTETLATKTTSPSLRK
jgi:hypothetical protein